MRHKEDATKFKYMAIASTLMLSITLTGTISNYRRLPTVKADNLIVDDPFSTDNNPFEAFDDIDIPSSNTDNNSNNNTNNNTNNNNNNKPFPNQPTEIEEYSPSKISQQMKELSLILPKKQVKDKYNFLVNSYTDGTYKFNYLDDFNVLVIKNEVLIENANYIYLNEMLGIGSTSFQTVSNNAGYKVEFVKGEENDNLLKVEFPKDGRGFLEIIVGNYPIVLYTTPVVEPTPEPTPEDNFNPIEETPDVPFIDDTINTDIIPPTVEDNSTDTGNFFDDLMTPDWIEGTGGGNPTVDFGDDNPTITDDLGLDEIQNNIDNIINELEEEKKPSRQKYKPIWGTTEQMKDKVEDGSAILDKNLKKKQNLNVIDIKGQEVDLVEKTRNTQPAEIKRERVDTVGEVDQTDNTRMYVIVGSILSTMLMGVSLFSIQKYYTETLKEIRKGVLVDIDLDIIDTKQYNVDDVKEIDLL